MEIKINENTYAFINGDKVELRQQDRRLEDSARWINLTIEELKEILASVK